MAAGLKERELEDWYKEQDWGEEEEQAWVDSVKKAQDWLKKENEKRAKAGQPKRVVVWIGSIVHELFPKVRGKPSPSFSTEEVMDFVHNVQREVYREKDVRPPPVNVVLFLGKDESESKNSSVKRLEDLAKDNRGKFRILKGMAALKNVTGRG